MDDEEVVRDVLCTMLDHLGYRADGASDGAEAIEKFSTARKGGDPFEAVILDLTVRDGMGGQEALEKLRQLDPDLKAIVSSGYSRHPVIGDHKAYGFAGAIVKPCGIHDLEALLHVVLPSQDRN